ncbi:MAG TPA: TMEM165/GDT1 family protein [Leptolyngbyaceae cyanobacterium]
MTTSPLLSNVWPETDENSSSSVQAQTVPIPKVETDVVGSSEAGETDVAAAASKVDFWRVFFSTFVTIFLAELGDKTQMTTLLMSAESHAPWVVFLGAGSALISTSLIGVLLGQWLASRLSPRTLDTAAGALLLAITVWLLWDITHL